MFQYYLDVHIWPQMEGKDLRSCECSSAVMARCCCPLLADSLIIHGQNMPHNEGANVGVLQRLLSLVSLSRQVCSTPGLSDARRRARLSLVVLGARLQRGRTQSFRSWPRFRDGRMEATSSVINFADAPDRAACRGSHPLNRILRH